MVGKFFPLEKASRVLLGSPFSRDGMKLRGVSSNPKIPSPPIPLSPVAVLHKTVGRILVLVSLETWIPSVVEGHECDWTPRSPSHHPL